MKLSEFTYDLPKELIAQKPLKDRDSSRLMVLDAKTGGITEGAFRDVSSYLEKGDCLVLNNTKVLSVRLLGKRKTGGRVEIFLLNPGDEKMEALVKPSKKIKEGEEIELDGGCSARVYGESSVGRFVSFDAPIEKVLATGHVPLPPYIERDDTPADKEAYQTVYAMKPGATASPTAGLHFTKELLSAIEAKGVSVAYVTLHTSYGTFAPVKEENIEDHVMHSEYYELDVRSADKINKARLSGGRIFAVGTTSARVLESASDDDGTVVPRSGTTKLFIYPGYQFKVVDSLITNFHLPGSTLLMLVSALAGKDNVFKAYMRAVELGFRFFSYGDAMLILR